MTEGDWSRYRVPREYDGWSVPGHIELAKPSSGPALRYAYVGPTPHKQAPDSPHLLVRFFKMNEGWSAPGTEVEFTQKRAEDVLAFAREFGPLLVCEHALPPAHHPECKRPPLEPVGYWWRVDRSLRGILAVKEELERGDTARVETWADVWLCGPEEAAVELERQGRPHGQLLADQLSWMLGFVSYQPSVEWRRGQLHMRLFRAREGLFGELLKITAFLATGSAGPMVCSGCRAIYTRAKGVRRPNPGDRNYCPACRERGVPQRDAARDYYRRKSNAEEGGTDVEA